MYPVFPPHPVTDAPLLGHQKEVLNGARAYDVPRRHHHLDSLSSDTDTPLLPLASVGAGSIFSSADSGSHLRAVVSIFSKHEALRRACIVLCAEFPAREHFIYENPDPIRERMEKLTREGFAYTGGALRNHAITQIYTEEKKIEYEAKVVALAKDIEA